MKGILLQKRNKKGFTLVELVIVVAVLAIIAGIAIPTVHNVIDNANKAADTSNAQAIEMAIKTCQSELAAEGTNGESDSLKELHSSGPLNELLSAYGVDLDLNKLKQSNFEFYYNETSGKVVAAKDANDAGDGFEQLKTEDKGSHITGSTYAVSGSTLTIYPDGKAD